jgi:hypothetical protein
LLRKWHDIKWIDPIDTAKPTGGRDIVINVGGLYTYNVGGLQSDLADRAVDAYLSWYYFRSWIAADVRSKDLCYMWQPER